MDHVTVGILYLILAVTVGGHALYDLGKAGGGPSVWLRMTAAWVQAILSIGVIGGQVH